MRELDKSETRPKTVKGPKAAVATFIRPRDGLRIYVFCRKGESRDNAITRVMERNGSKGIHYDLISP